MYKMVIVIRTDLKMGKGKIAAQAAHACLGSYRKADEKIVERWEREGSKKIVLKVEGLRKIKRLYEKAKRMGLPCFLVRDAGLTQIRKGSITALAIGPAEEEKVDQITGHLKLL